MNSSVCVHSKLFGKVLESHKCIKKAEPRDGNRNVVYFYSSAELLESVASCTEFVYDKSDPIANIS